MTTASLVIAFVLLIRSGRAQELPPGTPGESPKSDNQLNVNWLYGAYVPKEVPLESLTTRQRAKLYARQTFTTPGIYLKTTLFSISDQVTNSPPGWGKGIEGFGRRVASRQGQFIIQNSFSALGDALLQYEPRYNRCRCTGFWPRTRHALVRNFVTYNRTENEIRPRLATYVAAFGAGAISGTWKPGNPSLLREGYQGIFSQAGFGCLANWVGEFAPDIVRMLRRNKASAGRPAGPE